MTPPRSAALSPAKKGAGGMFKNLSTKQKRVLAVAGVGALLALIFLLNRRREPAEEEAGVVGPQAGEAFAVPAGSGGATDPTAFIGAQSEVLAGRLEDVGAGLGEVGAGLGEVGAGLADVERGQGDLGDQFMRGEENDQLRFDRLQASLGRQSRQIRGIQKGLQRRKRPGSKNDRNKPRRRKPNQKQRQRQRQRQRRRRRNR